MPAVSQANDAMIRRLEKELEERNAFAQGLIASVEDGNRDLNDTEKLQLVEVRDRMGSIQDQLTSLEATAEIAANVHARARQLDNAISSARAAGTGRAVEYRSAGGYLGDVWQFMSGNREAGERLEIFQRAASHQKTTDTLGIVPDPIVGPVISFIDASRPITSFIGPQPLTHGTWYRPKVTQHTSVGVQGSAGAAADEKTELLSQKMVISRLTGTAKTYGGYVNVSRQDIDFSGAPGAPAMDAVINDLASNYAVQTEAAMATALLTVTGTPVEIAGVNTAAHSAADLITALFAALAAVYNVTKGVGRYYMACSPDSVSKWAPLFAPVNVNPSVPGVNASTFGNGLQLTVAGIPLLVSAGLTAGTVGVVASTQTVECFEQRIGTLSITEPSVLGVQVAYAGYFTPLVIDATAGVKIVDAT
jgi:HK97 family phage major capsid protein